jgi:hypothetical protein
MEVIQGVKDERKILEITKTRKANWPGHILYLISIVITIGTAF